MRRVEGFTLLETITVIAVIAALTSILYPVMVNGKESASRARCGQHLHQAWLAVTIYRSDWDGDDIYGTSYAMGLPPRLGAFDQRGSLTWAQYQATLPESVLAISSLRCLHWPSKLGGSGNFSYEFRYQDPFQQPNGQNRWDKYALEFGEESILVTDSNHNDADLPLASPTFPKLGFGMTLGGRAVRQNKPGDLDILRWWSTDCSYDDCRL
jgi:prepilin-type N-terminal cleavage/methylation domain-containing protein